MALQSTYKLVVRNLYAVGKVVLGCTEVGNHWSKDTAREVETAMVSMKQRCEGDSEKVRHGTPREQMFECHKMYYLISYSERVPVKLKIHICKNYMTRITV